MVKEFDKILKTLCKKHAEERYGENIPPVVEVRLEHELGLITSHNFSGAYLLAYKATRECKNRLIPYHVRGNCGSSLTAFILGISHVNPLPAHYYCPRCGYTDFHAETGNFALCGFDLAKKTCPKCGEEFEGDGHDLPFESFAGLLGDVTPDFSVYLPIEDMDEISEVYNAFTAERDFSHNLISMGFSSCQLMRLISKMQTAVTVSEDCIPMDGGSVSKVLRAYDGDYKFSLEVLCRLYGHDIELDNFSDLTNLLGYSQTYFINENNMTVKGLLPLPDYLAAHIDDIYNVLMQFGVSKPLAYQISDDVSLGKLRFMQDEISKMRKNGVPEDYISYLSKICMINRKADNVEIALALYKLLWYRRYFPKEFHREIQKFPVGHL